MKATKACPQASDRSSFFIHQASDCAWFADQSAYQEPLIRAKPQPALKPA
jgi:hypothetical protein